MLTYSLSTLVNSLAPSTDNAHESTVSVKAEHLCGIPYDHAKRHCYELMRDFFRDNWGIELRSYTIPWDWDSNKLDLINDIHEREGFVKVPDWNIRNLRVGDVMCVAVRSGNPNHFVVYIGNNEILHHPLGQMSRIETMGDFYQMSTCYVIRHPAVPNYVPELPTTTIEALIHARYCPQADKEA